eukprot:GHUV01058737.1.p1 GENE.GHUV01058737.1~~GHUV01058737.1.p1  ORF type:complete len:121 (-),score=28.84 GHUV01058737.1:26-388(-)
MRLVLVYNLVWVGAPAHKPQLDSKSTEEPEQPEIQLQRALRAWEDDIAAGGQQKRIALLLGEVTGDSRLPWCCLCCCSSSALGGMQVVTAMMSASCVTTGSVPVAAMVQCFGKFCQWWWT